MSAVKNSVSEAPRASLVTSEETGAPSTTRSDTERAGTRDHSAADRLNASASHGSRRRGDVPSARAPFTDGSFLLALTLAIVGVLAFGVAMVIDLSRGFMSDHASWIFVSFVVLLAAISVAILDWWSKPRGTAVRAAAIMLVGFPAILIALGTVLFVLDPVWQVNTLRSVLVVILFLTPAVMWWLFLVVQRASLLNEFLANLQRLGLLDPRQSMAETEEARATRIDSYLQKFEATYGRIPQRVHTDVIRQNFRPYSREEAWVQPPVSIAAVPVLVTLVLLAIGWSVTLPPIKEMPEGRSAWVVALDATSTPVTFAFLGAYFFSIQMLFRRYVRADLRGSAYVAVVMRIILALIGVWVFQKVAENLAWPALSESQMLMVGFAVGVFPVVVWQVIRSLMASVFAFALPSLRAELALDGLDGLTVWHEARLEEEDIENIPNMATADIVSLLVCTRLPADRIVDWVDQAILLTYLGPDHGHESDRSSPRDRLASNGIRMASALLVSAKCADSRGESDSFAALVTDETGRSAMPSLLSSIRTNCNLDLVLRWRGMPDEVVKISAAV